MYWVLMLDLGLTDNFNHTRSLGLNHVNIVQVLGLLCGDRGV